MWDGVVAEAGGSWSHRFRSQEAKSKGPCCSALLLLFIWSETAAYETVLLTLKMGRDTAINLSKNKNKNKKHKHIQRFISMVILNLATLIIKINYYMYSGCHHSKNVLITEQMTEEPPTMADGEPPSL